MYVLLLGAVVLDDLRATARGKEATLKGKDPLIKLCA